MAITHDDVLRVRLRVAETGVFERSPEPRVRLDVAPRDWVDLIKLDQFVNRAYDPDEVEPRLVGELCGMPVYVDKTVTPGVVRARYRLPRRRKDTVLDIAWLVWGADP